MVRGWEQVVGEVAEEVEIKFTVRSNQKRCDRVSFGWVPVLPWHRMESCERPER